MDYISYKNGYKYQLVQEYSVEIPIKPGSNIETKYIKLSREGKMTIKNGYAWDGPSGLTIDTLNFMCGSLVHDALYQLMRAGEIDKEIYREPADRLLQKMCQKNGMSSIRAWWVYRGVRIFGDPAADPANKKQIIYAPDPDQINTSNNAT